MSDVAEKYILIDASYFHSAEVNELGIRMPFTDLLGTKSVEEYTTECVKIQIKNLAKKPGKQMYVKAVQTMSQYPVVKCSHNRRGKPVSSNECVLAVATLHGPNVCQRQKDVFGKWMVATTNNDLIQSLRNVNPEQEVISIVDGVVRLV